MNTSRAVYCLLLVARMVLVGSIIGCLSIGALDCLLSRMVFSDVAYAASDPMLPRDFTFSLPLLASNGAWNQTTTSASVLPDSDQQILVTYRDGRDSGYLIFSIAQGYPEEEIWLFGI